MSDTPTHGIHAPGRVLSYDPAVEIVIDRETLALLLSAARIGAEASDWADRVRGVPSPATKELQLAVAHAEGLMEAGE